MGTRRHTLLIVGAGHGGIETVKALANSDVDVIIVDKNNYHTFQALLYQVATAGLDVGDVAHQVRGIVRRYRNVRFRMGHVTGFDLDARSVTLEDGSSLPYDSLIVAAGAVYGDLGVAGVREHAFVLKSLRESVALRSHILHQFERAAREHDPARRRAHLTFVIAGAGPTGVEMAGALAEFYGVAAKDYPELADVRPTTVLVEASDRVLGMFSTPTRRYAEAVLRRLGVELRLETRVERVGEDHVVLDGGERIDSHTLVWSAGVRAHPLAEALDAPLGSGFRVRVTDRLHLAERREVFVIGDMSGVPGPDGHPYPMVAQVAMQQGKHAARTIAARAKGDAAAEAAVGPFRYRDRGMMAIIGRGAGIAELSPRLGGMRFTGMLGWLAWLFLHLIYLPGHQNRVRAFASWVHTYLTRDRHARLELNKPEETRYLRRTSGSMPRARSHGAIQRRRAA